MNFFRLPYCSMKASMNQYCLLLTQYRSILAQYHQVLTSAALYWPSTTIYQPFTLYNDPVPPSTNQYRPVLTQYHHISTSTTLYRPSTTINNQYCPLLTQITKAQAVLILLESSPPQILFEILGFWWLTEFSLNFWYKIKLNGLSTQPKRGGNLKHLICYLTCTCIDKDADNFRNHWPLWEQEQGFNVCCAQAFCPSIIRSDRLLNWDLIIIQDHLLGAGQC